MSLLGSLFGGRRARVTQVPTMTPEQQTAQGQLLQQLGPLLGQVQQPFDIGPIAQQARTQFQQQTVPTIAERFTAMGAGGQRGSAFPAALGRAGAGLEESLASLGAQTGLQQRGLQQQLLGTLLSGGLQPAFAPIYQPSQPGFFPGLLQQAAPGGMSLLLSQLGLGGSVLGGAGLGRGI